MQTRGKRGASFRTFGGRRAVLGAPRRRRSRLGYFEPQPYRHQIAIFRTGSGRSSHRPGGLRTGSNPPVYGTVRNATVMFDVIRPDCAHAKFGRCLAGLIALPNHRGLRRHGTHRSGPADELPAVRGGAADLRAARRVGCGPDVGDHGPRVELRSDGTLGARLRAAADQRHQPGLADLEDGHGRPHDALGPDDEHPSRGVAVHVLAGSRQELLPALESRPHEFARNARHDDTGTRADRRAAPIAGRCTQYEGSSRPMRPRADGTCRRCPRSCGAPPVQRGQAHVGLDRAAHHQRLARQGAHHPTRHEGRPHDIDGSDLECTRRAALCQWSMAAGRSCYRPWGA